MSNQTIEIVPSRNVLYLPSTNDGRHHSKIDLFSPPGLELMNSFACRGIDRDDPSTYVVGQRLSEVHKDPRWKSPKDLLKQLNQRYSDWYKDLLRIVSDEDMKDDKRQWWFHFIDVFETRWVSDGVVVLPAFEDIIYGATGHQREYAVLAGQACVYSGVDAYGRKLDSIPDPSLFEYRPVVVRRFQNPMERFRCQSGENENRSLSIKLDRFDLCHHAEIMVRGGDQQSKLVGTFGKTFGQIFYNLALVRIKRPAVGKRLMDAFLAPKTIKVNGKEVPNPEYLDIEKCKQTWIPRAGNACGPLSIEAWNAMPARKGWTEEMYKTEDEGKHPLPSEVTDDYLWDFMSRMIRKGMRVKEDGTPDTDSTSMLTKKALTTAASLGSDFFQFVARAVIDGDADELKELFDTVDPVANDLYKLRDEDKFGQLKATIAVICQLTEEQLVEIEEHYSEFLPAEGEEAEVEA